VILAIVILLFVASIVFVAAETALLRTNLPRALALRAEGRRGANRLVRVLEQDLAHTANTIVLLVSASQLTCASLVGILVKDVAGTYGAVLAIGIEIIAFYVLSEAAPKTWVIQHTDTAALRSAGLLWFVSTFPPLRWFARGLVGLANIILPGKGIQRGPFVSEAEIRQMADLAAHEAAIELEESELIHSIFEFGDTVVREVMKPRTDMVTVEADATVEHTIDSAIEAGYSRIPVVEDDPDHVVGVAILKDLVRKREAGRGHDTVRDYVRPAHFVPESKRVAELLREMQTQKFHLALVVDEYGGTAGLVTLEDLLEEIVGEITDEYDVDEPIVERLTDGRLRVPGRTPIDDLSEQLGLELPNVEWDTVGGLVFNTLGHVPAPGETLVVGPIELCAEDVQDRRIVSVLVRTRTDDEISRDGS
jgi:putative hemolysin